MDFENEFENSLKLEVLEKLQLSITGYKSRYIFWLEEKLAEARLEIEKYKEMIRVIPCTCDEAYKNRRLTAPDCPRCNWIDMPADFKEVADKEFWNIKAIESFPNDKKSIIEQCRIIRRRAKEILDNVKYWE